MASISEPKESKLLSPGIGLCAGIDPQLTIKSKFLSDEIATYGNRSFLMRYCEVILGALPDQIRAVKFQSAYFEARGNEGIQALQFGINRARQLGKYVILDAKRGDIGSTMTAYGEFAFQFLNADCLTVNPFVGFSCIEGISKWLESGKSVYLVMFTSSGKDDVFQESLLDEMSRSESGISKFFSRFEASPFQQQIGIVIGAQRIDSMAPTVFDRLRKFSWLVPGIGAQGGAFSSRLNLRARDASSTLISVSRDLTGDMQLEDLGFGTSVKSWSDFEIGIAARAADYWQQIQKIRL